MNDELRNEELGNETTENGNGTVVYRDVPVDNGESTAKGMLIGGAIVAGVGVITGGIVLAKKAISSLKEKKLEKQEEKEALKKFREEQKAKKAKKKKKTKEEVEDEEEPEDANDIAEEVNEEE